MRDNRFKIAFSIALAFIVLDQITKYVINLTIPRQASINVIDGFFNLVNIRNRGAAFGFLNNPDIEWQFWLFLVAGVVAIVAIIWILNDAKNTLLSTLGLGSILGGAIGNMIDRVRMREVVDFLDFHIGTWHWPAFNVADIAICIGAFLVIYSMWKEEKA